MMLDRWSWLRITCAVAVLFVDAFAWSSSPVFGESGADIGLDRSAVPLVYGRASSGSGFVLGNQVVTAKHVVTGNQGLAISWSERGSFAVQVVCQTSERDVALLSTTLPSGIASLRVSAVGPRDGDPVAFAGWPKDGYRVVQTRVEARMGPGLMVKDREGTTRIDSEVLVLYDPTFGAIAGFSGGPVVNVREEVVGMVIAHQIGVLFRVLAVPIPAAFSPQCKPEDGGVWYHGLAASRWGRNR